MATISPTIPQHEFITCKDKFPALVAGYGAGKTEALVVRAILQKLEFPNNDRAFYEPTYDLVRMIAWPRFEEKLTDFGIPYRLIKSPQNVIQVEGHGNIYFRSLDTPSRIIGYEVGDSDCDELDTLKLKDAEEAWIKIIARNRQKKPNGALNTVAVATTPEGFNFVYKHWKQKPREGYRIIRAPSASNPHLPEDYIQTLKERYPPSLISAYLEGEFVNLKSGTVYHCYNREKNVSHETHLINPDGSCREDLMIGMDFNVGKMAAIVHVRRGEKMHAVDEIINGYDTPDMIRQIKERYWRFKDGKYQKTCTIRIYPDSSGGSRKSVNAALSDISELEAAGFQVYAHSQNPPIKDRINAVNALLCNASGVRNYLVNTKKCPTLADCLEQQSWADNGEPDKSSDLDHPVDAMGYFVYYECPLIKPATKLNIKLPI